MKKNLQKNIVIALVLLCICGAAFAVKISLDSPASFPVDI